MSKRIFARSLKTPLIYPRATWLGGGSTSWALDSVEYGHNNNDLRSRAITTIWGFSSKMTNKLKRINGLCHAAATKSTALKQIEDIVA